jgi:subtilase family serine protease
VPTALAPVVSGVVGLDDSAQLVHTDLSGDPDAPPSPAFVTGQPCSAYWGQLPATGFPNPYGKGALPYAPCGYTPQQIKGAYGISGFDGSGQTVAIIDAYASPTIQQDLDQWSANRRLPSTRITQVVAPGTYRHPGAGQKQDPQGWYGEETLDIEAVHGMAPAANIIYVGAPNAFQDLDAALNHVVDQHLASIVTNSYGFPTELLPPGYIQAFEDTILQGVAEGIGIYFASGDNSDESLVVGYASPDWPASSPYVTAVGGTSLGVGWAPPTTTSSRPAGDLPTAAGRAAPGPRPRPAPGSMAAAAASAGSSPSPSTSKGWSSNRYSRRRAAPAGRSRTSRRWAIPTPAIWLARPRPSLTGA